MNMTFRQVKSSEVDEGYALYLSVFRWLNGQGIRQWLVPLSLDIFVDRQRSGKLFAQFVEDYLIAIVTIAYEQSRYWTELIGQDQYWWIQSLAVSCQYRGKGIGKQIMMECEAIIQEAGYPEAYLDCVADGILPGYYTQLDYKVLGYKDITYPSGNTFPMVLMRKTLPNQRLYSDARKPAARR